MDDALIEVRKVLPAPVKVTKAKKVPAKKATKKAEPTPAPVSNEDVAPLKDKAYTAIADGAVVGGGQRKEGAVKAAIRHGAANWIVKSRSGRVVASDVL